MINYSSYFPSCGLHWPIKKISHFDHFISCRTFTLTLTCFIAILLMNHWPFICNFRAFIFIGMLTWRFITYCPTLVYVKQVGFTSLIPNNVDWDSWTLLNCTLLNVPENPFVTIHLNFPFMLLSSSIIKFVSPTPRYFFVTPLLSSTVWQYPHFILMSFLKLFHHWTLFTSVNDFLVIFIGVILFFAVIVNAVSFLRRLFHSICNYLNV